MPFDAFINIDGAKGESTDKKYKDWIEMSSFSIGTVQMGGGEVSTSGSLTAGRGEVSPFSFSHAIDKASVKLMEMCMTGTHSKKVEVVVCRADKSGKIPYYKIKMDGVLIESVSLSGSEPMPYESVTLRPSQITWTYVGTGHGTGGKKDNIETGWDCVKNAKKS